MANANEVPEDCALADALEQAAEMARRGELTSAVMVGVADDQGVVTVKSIASSAYLPMLGAIELVKAGLIDEANSER